MLPTVIARPVQDRGHAGDHRRAPVSGDQVAVSRRRGRRRRLTAVCPRRAQQLARLVEAPQAVEAQLHRWLLAPRRAISPPASSWLSAPASSSSFPPPYSRPPAISGDPPAIPRTDSSLPRRSPPSRAGGMGLPASLPGWLPTAGWLAGWLRVLLSPCLSSSSDVPRATNRLPASPLGLPPALTSRLPGWLAGLPPPTPT